MHYTKEKLSELVEQVPALKAIFQGYGRAAPDGEP